VANNDANIDLLFRNGLKDLEVLPPVEAWSVILPAVRKKQMPVIFLRNAAMIALLLSVGFLAYKWGHDYSAASRNPLIALGEESVRYQGNPVDPAGTISSGTTNRQSAASADNQPEGQAVNDTQLLADPDFIAGAMGAGTDLIPFITDRTYIPRGDILPFPESGFVNNKIGYESLEKFSYTEPKNKVDRWSLMAMASPTYYLTAVTGNDDISRQMSSSEQSQISYSGGVGFSYKISRKLSVQSGLYYSSVGQQVNGINSFGGFRPYDFTKGDHNFEVMTSNGLISTNNGDVFLLDRSGDRVMTRYTNDVFDPDKAQLSYLNNSLYQNFSYLEMPVILRYKLIDRAIDFNLIGGLSYNLLINNSVTTIMEGNKYPIGTTGLNPFMVSSSFGMGMEYNLTEKFSFNLEPTFRYYMNPFGSMAGIKVHPYSIGIFSGLSFKF